MAAELYDSGKVREAAHAVKALSSDLEDGVMGASQNAIMEVETLKGHASEALAERLSETRVRTARICDGLMSIAKALYRYADALEAVDDELRVEMQRG